MAKSGKEAFFFYNSLTGLVKAIENKYTTIDLRNEATVTGKVVSVDGYMNIELENAVFYDARGSEIPFSTFFIRARNVRYVHIPTDIPIFQTIKNMAQGNRVNKVKTKPVYKIQRAKRRQQETLAELAHEQNKND